MKHTYKVEFHGQTFTRKSDRVYTHLVVGRQSIENNLRVAKSRRATDLKNHAFYVRESNPSTRKYPNQPPEDTERYMRAAAMSAKAYADEQMAERLAAIEEHRLAGGFDEYHNLGWSSRRDLAQKNASKRSDCWVDIKILDVPV